MGFVANFICFPAVQNFWKSVKIWQSYREFTGGTFFWDTVYIHVYMCLCRHWMSSKPSVGDQRRVHCCLGRV